MQRQSLLHQSLREINPESFIRKLINKAPAEVEMLDPDSQMNAVQHAAFMNRTEVFLIIAAVNTANLDSSEPIPHDECVDEKDPTYRRLKTNEQTPFMLATEKRTRFSFMPEVLWALGINKQESISLCRNEATREAMQAVTLDFDIVRGLLFWVATNTNKIDLLNLIEKQIETPPSTTKTVVDTKVDKKEDTQKIKLLTLENDLLGLIELAAQKKSALVANKFIAMNQNRIRSSDYIKTVGHWALQHDLKEMYPLLNDDNAVQEIMVPMESKIALSVQQKKLYERIQLGEEAKLIALKIADSDLFAIINHADKHKDFVVLNTIIQLMVEKKEVHLLLNHAITTKNRGLFFIIFFAAHQNNQNLERFYSHQLNDLYDLLGRQHEKYDLIAATPPETTFNAKIELINDFLQSLNTSAKQFGILERLWYAPRDQQWVLAAHIIAFAGNAVAGYYFNSDLQNNNLYPNADNADNSSHNDNSGYYMLPLIYDIVYLFGGFIFPFLKLYRLSHKENDSLAYLFLRTLFNDLGYKKITEISADLTQSTERFITKIQTHPDFKLTTDSTIDEFNDALLTLRDDYKKLQTEGMFASREAPIINQIDQKKLPQTAVSNVDDTDDQPDLENGMASLGYQKVSK